MSILKKCLLGLLSSLLIVLCTSFVLAEEEKCSLSFSFKTDSGMAISGAEFRLYLLSSGPVTEKGYELNDRFEDCYVNMSNYDQSSANGLYFFIQNNGLEADYTAVSDENGVVKFDDLTAGLYLVVGDSVKVTEGDKHYVYSPMMSIVPLPYWQDGELITDGEIVVKSEFITDSELINRAVVKVWEGVKADAVLTEVVVDLYRDGELYDSVVLSRDNDWSYKWIGLSVYSEWFVKEHPVSGYESKVVLDNDIFVVTNTLIPTPEVPTIPNTGVLWWPVPVLLVCGFVLVLFGRLKKDPNA